MSHIKGTGGMIIPRYLISIDGSKVPFGTNLEWLGSSDLQRASSSNRVSTLIRHSSSYSL